MLSKKTLFAAGLTALVAATATAAVAQQAKPEEILKQRQGLMQAIKAQNGPIFGFAAGRAELPADAAARATNVAAAARMSVGLYEKGQEGIKGSGTKDSALGDAKFAALLKDLASSADRLAAAATAGDTNAAKAAAGDLGKTCKACHDDYRAD